MDIQRIKPPMYRIGVDRKHYNEYELRCFRADVATGVLSIEEPIVIIHVASKQRVTMDKQGNFSDKLNGLDVAGNHTFRAIRAFQKQQED